jgi:hypothetical protein
MDWLPERCVARIRSRSVPPGAVSFDSGLLHPGEGFEVELPVGGDWELEDVINGGRVTLTVEPPVPCEDWDFCFASSSPLSDRAINGTLSFGKSPAHRRGPF